MPGSAAKCFKTEIKNNSNQDYIHRKKAQTIYNNFLNIKVNNKKYNKKIYTDSSGCISSVGGINVENYELLSTLNNGKCLSENDINNNCRINNNDTQENISTCIKKRTVCSSTSNEISRKCFKLDSNQLNSSKDHLDKKKAISVYQSVKNQSTTINTDNHGFLGAVGGYDIENYNLKLNIAKGRSYSEDVCISHEDISLNILVKNRSDLCIDSNLKCTTLNTGYELYEGSILQIKSKTINNCKLTNYKNYMEQYDPYYINTQFFTKLANRDKLSNLYLNSKIPLCNNNETRIESYNVIINRESVSIPKNPGDRFTSSILALVEPGDSNNILIVNGNVINHSITNFVINIQNIDDQYPDILVLETGITITGRINEYIYI